MSADLLAPPVVPLPELRPADLWRSGRPELAAIEHEARRRIASPWAVLAATLARSLLTIPYTVRYRSKLHPEGTPLNSAYALVGASGTGKSTATRGAASAVQFEGEDVPEQTSARSGEGIAQLLGYMATPEKGADPELVWRRPDHALWAHWDEVGMLTAQGARTGSTVLESIKSVTSGEHLGGQNARGDGLALPAGSYRATLTVAVQPRRAGALLSDECVAGGFTARFLWFQMEDADAAAAELPEDPTQTCRVGLSQWDGVRYVDALPEMDAAHEADTRAALRGERDALSSRRLLNRAIAAIALANLAGRSHLIASDWRLAGAILAHSDDTLADVRRRLAEPDPEQAHAEQAEEDALRDRLATLRAQGVPFAHVPRKLGKRQRELFAQLKQADAVVSW